MTNLKAASAYAWLLMALGFALAVVAIVANATGDGGSAAVQITVAVPTMITGIALRQIPDYLKERTTAPTSP